MAIPHSQSRSRASSHASEPPTSGTDGDGSDGDALRSTFAASEEDDTIERAEDTFSQHQPLSWTARKSAVSIQHTPSRDDAAITRLPTTARPVITNLNRRGNSQGARQLPPETTGNEQSRLAADTNYSQVPLAALNSKTTRTVVQAAGEIPKLRQSEGGSSVGAAFVEKEAAAYSESESELSVLETEDELELEEGVKTRGSRAPGVGVQGSGPDATKPANGVPSVSGYQL